MGIHHNFDIEIAAEIGLNEAIIATNLYYWIKRNEANNINFFEDTYWTYNSVKAFATLFPYLTPRKINLALDRLKEMEIIKTGNFNETKYDRTTWYTLTEKGRTMFEKPASTTISQNVKCDLQNAEDNSVKITDKEEFSEKITAGLSENILQTRGKPALSAISQNVKCNLQNVEPIPDNKPDIKPNIQTKGGKKGFEEQVEKIQNRNYSENLKAALTNWLIYKAERKENYKDMGFRSFLTQIENRVEEFGENAVIGLIEMCMADGYKGIIWEKLKANPTKPISQSKSYSHKEIDDIINSDIFQTGA